MDKVRVFYRLDGGVSIFHPAPKSKRPDETEDAWFERVSAKAMRPNVYDDEGKLLDGSPYHGLPYDDVDVSTLPADRSTRDAWEGEKGKGVKVNQGKANKIAKAKERTEKIEAEKNRMAEQSLIARGEL